MSELQNLPEIQIADALVIDETSGDTIAISSNQNIKMTFKKKSEGIKIHSDKLNLDFTAYIQDETNPQQQRCYIMTIHDIGCDYTSYDEFISCPEMRCLKDRIIWIHVDLPGQEANATDLKISKYPNLADLAGELSVVLDHFKVAQVVCFGEGAGANIAARFAIAHPTRCLGVALIHPTGNTASFMETFKEKIHNLIPLKQTNSGLSASSEAYLIWHRYGRSSGDNQLVQANIKEFQTKLYENRNPKNLALFVDAFVNRSNIIEKLDELKVDVLTAVGKKASLAGETKKFYKALYETRKDDRSKLVNCPLLGVEDVGDVIGETPDRLAISLQFFLQGIGLLPAMPMKTSLQGLGRLSRAFSMEDADRPRRISISDPHFFPRALVK